MKALLSVSLLVIIFITGCKKSSTSNSTSDLPAPPASLGLDAFYKKYVDAGGIPIVSSEKVADGALLRARDIVNDMMSEIPDVKAKMIQNKIRVGIIARSERPTQMPEYRDLYTAFPGTDWDTRARAYGATLARPLTTDCEENLMCQTGDMYHGEEILTHEFSHAIHELGLRFTNPNFDSQLQAAFDHAHTAGLWTNTYAGGDIREYWAEGVQDYFNCNLEAIPSNGVHNQVNTRTELQSYDPMLFNLIKTYFTSQDRRHGCY